jgi:hypothetical protein
MKDRLNMNENTKKVMPSKLKKNNGQIKIK